MKEKSTTEQIEKDATLRATLGERYQKEKRKKVDGKDDDHIEENNIITRDFYIQIKGIQTDINEDYDSLTDLRESVKNVNKIRFELENGKYTQWYEWHPNNTSHQLTHIVDYYADGDIADIIGEKVSVSNIYGNYYINYPTPYNSRISHILYPIYQKLRLFENTDEDKYAVVTGINEAKSDVDPDNKLSIFLSSESAYALGTLHTIAMLLGFTYGFIQSTLIGLIPMILTVLVQIKITNSNGFTRGLITGIPTTIFKFIHILMNKIKQLFESIDKYEPIDE